MLKVESSQWLQAQKAFLLNGNLRLWSSNRLCLRSFETISYPIVLESCTVLAFRSSLRRTEVYISEPRLSSLSCLSLSTLHFLYSTTAESAQEHNRDRIFTLLLEKIKSLTRSSIDHSHPWAHATSNRMHPAPEKVSQRWKQRKSMSALQRCPGTERRTQLYRGFSPRYSLPTHEHFAYTAL
jgi:hypothetical protein